jgi:two-component system, chemotaxis family, chemotaxis protein CheY
LPERQQPFSPAQWPVPSRNGSNDCKAMPVVSTVSKMARILIIDDDPAVRLLLEGYLCSAGHAVSLAADGGEALEQFRSNPADLVITDIYMPNREGLETITDLRRRDSNLPIIAMSGRPLGPAMLDIARHLGAVVTLQKPFSREDLLEAVAKAL